MNGRDGRVFALGAVNFYIVTDRVGWPKADHGAGCEPFLIDDLLQHRVGVGFQRAGRLADHVVFENAGVGSRQIPGAEERRPVDALDQFGQIILFEHLGAGECRFRR